MRAGLHTASCGSTGGANKVLRQRLIVGVPRAARVAPQAAAVAGDHALAVVVARAAGARHQPLLRTPCIMIRCAQLPSCYCHCSIILLIPQGHVTVLISNIVHIAAWGAI